ncbi:MAG: sigma 54-interacting transcriptional regulator [Desulfovibrionaceae bacterium]
MHTAIEKQRNALFALCLSIAHAHDLKAMLHDVLRILGETLHMTQGAISIQDMENGPSGAVAVWGTAMPMAGENPHRLSETAMARVFRAARPFAVPRNATDPVFPGNGRGRINGKASYAILGAPVFLSGQPVGLISVDHLFEETTPLDNDLDFLGMVAAFVAQAVACVRNLHKREEHLVQESEQWRAKAADASRALRLVGKSAAMDQVRDRLQRVIPGHGPVLLFGETGTGKSLAARLLHERSARAGQPFIKVNCGSLPQARLEQDLFGRGRHALTGANSTPGRLEDAEGGIVLLSEVELLGEGAQARLVRYLTDGVCERMDGTVTHAAARIVACSTNLEGAMRSGMFRPDLYRLLAARAIRLPSLREHKDDIPSLLNHFLDIHSREFGRRLYLTPKALGCLMKYDWPGNVREMEHLVERLSLMVEGDAIDLVDIPSFFFSAVGPHVQRPDELVSLKDIERHEVVTALERHNWIQSRAARELGITQRQMGYRVKKFSLQGLIDERRRQLRSRRPGH